MFPPLLNAEATAAAAEPALYIVYRGAIVADVGGEQISSKVFLMLLHSVAVEEAP